MIRVAVVAAIAISSLASLSEPAAAYCPTGSYYVETIQAGGKQEWGFFEVGPQAGSAWINSYLPDPVVAASTSWSMLNRHYVSPTPRAQDGWLRRGGWSNRYLFSQTRRPNGSIREAVHFGVIATGSHTYEVHHFGWDNSFGFYYDGSLWDYTEPNQGWQPSRADFGSESKNRQDHFPGSTINKIEHWGVSIKRNEVWSQANLTYVVVPPGSFIAGLDILSNNNFKTYDKRCTD